MHFINRKRGRSGGIALIIAGILALSGCQTPGKIERKPGEIGQMSKFDIVAASPDDIAQALKEDGRVAISGNLLFETDSAKLAPSAADVVRRVTDMLRSNPDINVAVVGHTDSTGEYKHNMQLSERRAKAMADALLKQGIASNRLTAVGIGQLSPVASNETAEGRAQNRRVELVLIH